MLKSPNQFEYQQIKLLYPQMQSRYSSVPKRTKSTFLSAISLCYHTIQFKSARSPVISTPVYASVFERLQSTQYTSMNFIKIL